MTARISLRIGKGQMDKKAKPYMNRTCRSFASLLLVGVVLLLSACAPKTSGKVLSFVHANQAYDAVYRDLAEAFTADRSDGLKIEVELLSLKDYEKRLNGKNLPDLLGYTGDLDFADLTAKDKLLNLAGVLDLDGIEDQGLLDTASETNSLYLLPLTFRVPLVMYKTDLFEQYGLTTAESNYDLIRLCSFFVSEGITALDIGRDAAGQYQAMGILDSLLMNSAAAGGLWDADDVLNQGFIDFTALAYQFHKKSITETTDSTAAQSAAERLTAGDLAMYINNTNDIDVLKLMDRNDYHAFTIPGSFNKGAISADVQSGLAVSAESQLQTEAVEFLSYILASPQVEEAAAQANEFSLDASAPTTQALKRIRELFDGDKLEMSMLQSLTQEQRQICTAAIDEILTTEINDTEAFIRDLEKDLEDASNG